MTDAVDAARDRIGQAIFADWAAQDFDDLVRLMGRFTDAIRDE